MASIGQELRRARTQRGAELNEVERVTKIRGKFLEAMEDDRWENLPGPPYTRHFLSTYAQFLGLDEEELLERYKREAEPPEHVEAIPRTVIRPGSVRRPHSVRPNFIVIGGLALVILLAVVIGVSLGGSGGGGGPQKGKKSAKGHGRQSTSTSPAASTGTTTATAAVSLELRATDVVWVCVVDDRGRPDVNSETLSAGETRGPFEGSAFEATFGNGSIEMTVNGEPTKVPQLAEPVSVRVTAEGTQRLDPGAGPTCI